MNEDSHNSFDSFWPDFYTGAHQTTHPLKERHMDFGHSPRAQAYIDRVKTFMRDHVIPAEGLITRR